MIFEFNQSVGGTLGAVRVYDAQGDEVDNLDVSHPDGKEHWMGVGLKPHLPDGTYTATYRVISADTHIVYGGMVFNIGHPGAAPKFTVAGLIGRNESGPGHEGRVRRGAGARLPVDRADDRRARVPVCSPGSPASRPSRAPSRGGRRPRAAFARRAGDCCAAAVVLGVLVERARRPAAGGERGGRLAVEPR